MSWPAGSSGFNYPDRMIRYDCKTTSTEFTIVAYANSNSKHMSIGDIKQAALGSANTVSSATTVTLNNGSITTQTYTINSSTRASLYVSVDASNNAFIVQIIATEKGTAHPTPGNIGYIANFNKTRLVVRSGNETQLDNNTFLFKPNENQDAGNKTYFKMQTKGTHYIKFTTGAYPSKVTVNVSSSTTYYIGTSSSATTNSATASQTVELAKSTTYYINPNGSNVQVTGIKFEAIPYSVSHSLTNVTKTSGSTGAGAAQSGSNYDAVFAAADGYDLPDDITVTIGGAAATAGTDYTWNSSTGAFQVPAAKVTGAIVVTIAGEAAAAGSGWGIASSDNSWTASADGMSGSGTVTKTLSLSANADLQFKIVDISGNTWYGNGEIWGGTKTQSVSSTGTANNCHLLTTEAGSYTFSFNTSTKDLTITYPNSYTFYYANTSSWSNVYVYKFTSNGSTGNNAAWPGVEIAEPAYTCGGKDYYAATSDGYAKLIFTNNSGNQTGDMVVSSSDAGKYVGGTGSSWSAFPTYTISYAANGGSSSMSSQTGIACGTDKATTANSFTAPSGYQFAGWKANVDVTVGGSTKTAGTVLDNGVTIQNISSNITLTAQWELIPTYDVIYNTNGGTGGSTASQTGNLSGAQVTTSANGFTRSGYKFKWWNTAANGSGEDFYPGEKVTIASADVNLYAQWEQVADNQEFWTPIDEASKVTGVAISKTAGDMSITSGGATDAADINVDVTASAAVVNKYNSSVDKHAKVLAIKTTDKYIDVHFTDGSPINKLWLGATTNQSSAQNIVVVYSATSDFTTAGGAAHEFKQVGSTTNLVQLPANTQATKSVTDVSPSTENTYYYARIYRRIATANTVFDNTANLGSDKIIRIYSIKAQKGVSCVAPTAVNITGTYHYFPGETISLTAAAEGGSGTSTTYQWYKGGTADGNIIEGATSAIYSKASCTFADAGSYYCKVTRGGSCSTFSDSYDVKILHLYVNTGRNGTPYGDADFVKVDATTARATISLGASWDYGFNIADGCGHYYGNSGSMNESDCTGWTMNVDGTDCLMRTTNGATYTFTVDYTTLTAPVVSITYPSANQAADKVIYFDNSARNWSTLHYRIGKTNHTQATDMTQVPGTANLYKVTTEAYNNFSGWHIANNAGWTGVNNSIYRTYTDGDEYSITYATAHEGGAVTESAVTVTPTTSRGNGSDEGINNNCEFYNYTITNGMKTDNVSITAPSNGTISVAYTDVEGASQSFTSGNRDLAHTVIITPTATPAEGYTLSGLTVNGAAHTSGNTYTVTTNTTIAATFSPASYTVTLNTNGGTINAGNVTSYTYGTGATLPTNVTKSGFTFGGWYDNSGLTGSAVTTISTTATGNKEYWAKWTAAASLTALVSGTLYTPGDMLPTGVSISSSSSYEEGLSDNTKFFIVGDASETENAGGVPEIKTNTTVTYDGIDFTEFCYFKGAANKSTNTPTSRAIKFIIPGTGNLIVYGNSNIKLYKEGTDATSDVTYTSNKATIAVTADTYYLYADAKSKNIVGIKFVAAVPCTTAPTVTAGSNSSVTSTTVTVSCASGISSLGTGGCTIISYGFVIGTATGPTIGGSGVTQHEVGTTYTTTGTSFSKDLTGLTASTTYYVRPYATNGFGTAYGTETSFTTTAAATLYTVTFNSNGGSAVSPATQASAGASIAKPSDPTRASYEFDGWYTTAGEKISWPYTPTADITLYVRWQEACDAEGVAKSTTDVVATGYTAYQEKGGSNVVFTSAPSLGFKYKDADGNTINSSTTAVVRNNAYSCQIKSDSGNKGSIKTNSTFSNVDSISFYFAASDKGGCKIAVWCSTDNFSTDSTSLLSATTYGDSNNEFKLKTLAIPAAKKTSALTFKFRFTVTGAGKTCYMDSLKVYSSTSGGGTCYHVYYHGNGAESGYVNDTVSYTAGSKATVLNYNYGRYPLAKAGNDFQGWATSAGGAVAYTAGQKIDITSADVDLYAVWATASTALVTWEKKVNVATWTDNTTPSTTDPTNIGTIGSSATLIASPSSTSGKTPQIQLASGASNADKGASFTFSMKSADKVVVPTKVSCEVANVGSESNSDITYKAVLTDGAGNTYYSTNSICPNNNGTLNPIDFVFSSGLSLRGDITVKVYAWLSGSGSGFSFRMGPDVKFYGTVEDYACATPSAPTISGVSEYAVGQTITLTASHDGENYDNLTTYTWYRGADWATASAASPVQAAATGGYTLTKTAVAADDDLFWCKVSNGTCEAHNATGYNVNVYAANTITWHLNDGTWGEVEHKDSYTRFDDDYTLPIPSKDGYVFAGWYEASDFSGVTVTVLGSGAIGDKNYYAKWGTAVTVSWTVTKVDGKLYRGGGGYSVKAVINETDWNTGFMDELELTATEGVTLKNIEVSENDESKVQVTADFDITTDLAADATEISFTLNVPADGTYGPKVDEREEDLTDCGGGASGYTEFFSMIPKANTCSITNTTAYNASNHYTTCDCTSSATITTGGSVTFGLYSSGTGTTDKFWEYNSKNGGWKHSIANSWVVLYSTDQFKAGDSIVITNGNTSSSGYYTIVAAASNNTADYHSASQVAAPSTTSPAKNTNYYYKLPVSFVSSNYLVIRSSTSSSCYVGTIKAYHAAASSGVTPTLTWDDGDADIANDGVSKSTSNDDFIYTASQDKNSLGAITYSSSDATVATVNATTGQVHLVGAAGTATITATIAASGCFSSANVSYTITVTDDCDDEAGTIETEDLGCSGVKMTVTGHTAAAGVIYQWYKVGTPSDATVGTNQDNFTATEAGSYYVIVTNTGDRHCAKRSTNTITVEAQAAATATKIVDSWYVKNGRRTPDIELVKTTNATSFTVTSGLITIWESAGSTKTGFGGCGFHMDENGIIYLNGTKDDDGSATTGLTAGDETLTITAIGCGGNASQNITIHKQTATDYKEIAFVVDGEKGKDFDQVTSGHAAGTELYTYLDSVGTAAGKRLFKLTQQNIYSTTDEKAIRQHYSQFDGILITDDPSTNTTPEGDYKTKGYVNAFGTMVDVRPIFTMEAYVSALKNWGSKGIAGNPQSPNPRQYEMRLECKDHEIYKSGLPDPEDGTNVWEETIGGETFRHVIIVDSTKGVYNGVAYNAETAGNQKPALQGFTGEAAGSLLGLGRILEGTLQAAIERQEEPAARLLVMGINAKALQPTCALTNEGKAVIKNILTYLLKTNMEEVDDCSNYFTGKNSTSWSDPGNWSKSALPSSEAKVRILAPCVISGIQPHVLQVSIVNSGNSNIRYTATSNAVCNGTLTINADGALIADGKIRSAVAPHFAANDLMPTTPEMLTINTNGSGQAALIFNNEEGLTKAKVNLHSLGRNDGSYKYQYFAIPMEYVSVSPAFANETHGGTKIYTYVYNEASSGWTRRGYYDDLYAFEGLGITTKSTVAMNYTMTGTLASTSTKEITLTHDGAGLNLIGNSWMAPIQIGALAEDNTDANITKTVYIYCAGRDIVEGAATSGVTETAGQWLAVPFEAADFATWKGLGKLSVIPAMQAFQIKTAAKATLTLDYDKVVRGSTNDLNAKLRAPRRRVAAKEVTMTNIRVSDSKTHTDLSLFEGERFSDEFDNGWEAEYMNGDGRSAKLYAETVDGKMAVVAMTDYEGTMVGFAPGQESVYIFSFMGADNGYYLNDIKMQQSVRISEGETYSFTYEDGDDASRFMISRTPFEKPGVATGTENIDASVPQARKILYNDKLYIIRGGHMYDATGKMVK